MRDFKKTRRILSCMTLILMLWIFSECSLTALWPLCLLFECSYCSLSAIWPRKLKIESTSGVGVESLSFSMCVRLTVHSSNLGHLLSSDKEPDKGNPLRPIHIFRDVWYSLKIDCSIQVWTERTDGRPKDKHFLSSCRSQSCGVYKLHLINFMFEKREYVIWNISWSFRDNTVQ